MVKIRIRDLRPAVDVLAELMPERVSARTALRMRRLARVLETALDDLGSAQADILRAHGALEDERGFVPQTQEADGRGRELPGTFVIQDREQDAAARAKLQALQDEEVELGVEPLSAARMIEDGMHLSGLALYVLGDLVVDDEPEREP